jgi:hypothetical protein
MESSNIPGNVSPGEHLQKTLLQLAEQQVEIHLVASRFDTVAEWRNNTEKLYKGTASQPRVYWWFPPGEPPDLPPEAPKYGVQAKLNPLKCESLREIWIHASLDCTINAPKDAGNTASNKTGASKQRQVLKKNTGSKRSR